MPLPRYLQDEDEADERLPFLDEEEDGLPEPPIPGRPPQLSPDTQRAITPPPPQLGPAPVTERASQARAALAEAKGNMPLPPQPKWWQRLAAGAIGGMAGYENATGRTRQIDPTAAVQGIMGAGKYNRDILKHQQDVTGAQANADAASQDEAAWWRNRQLNNQEALQQAQAEQAAQHGEYWRHRAEMEQNQWKLNPKTGEMYNTVTGEVHGKAPNVGEHIKDLVAAGYSQEEAKIVASGGHLVAEKPVAEPKPRNLVNVAPGHSVYDPESGKTVFTAPGKPEGERKPPTPMQMKGVEDKKNDRLNALEAAAKREIARALTSPVIGPNGAQEIDPAKVAAHREQQKQAIYQQLESDKQRIQNEYEGEIGAATGNYPGHMEYADKKPVDAAPQAPAAAHPAGAPKPLTGERVRVRLSNGKVGTVDASEYDPKTMTQLPKAQ